MTHNNEWSELSDSYAEHTPRIVGKVIRPSRPLTAADLDDIFAGRRLADAMEWTLRPAMMGTPPRPGAA